MTNNKLDTLIEIINQDYSDHAFLVSDISQEDKLKSQNKLNALMDDNPSLCSTLSVEELLNILISAKNHGYNIQCFEHAALEVLKDEKVFNLHSEIYNLMDVMNDFSHNLKMTPVIENFVKILNNENVSFFAYDSERSNLHLNFLINFSLNNNDHINIKEKTYLWGLALETLNIDFARWLNEKEVNYQYEMGKFSIFDMFFHYNIKKSLTPLVEIFYQKEKSFRKENNLDITCQDLINKSINLLSDTIFIVLTKPIISFENIAHYQNLLNMTIPEYSEDKNAKINMIHYLIEKEKELIENQLDNHIALNIKKINKI
jgi:hypothetical protein